MRPYGRIVTELAIARACIWQCSAEGDAAGCRHFRQQEAALLAELEAVCLTEQFPHGATPA